MRLSRRSIERLLYLAQISAARTPEAIDFVNRCRKALLPEERKAKSGRSSRNKGRAGEVEARHYLVEQGFPEAQRGLGQSRGGGKEVADCVNIGDLHVEVKRVERLNIHAALAQAEHDVAEGYCPIVLHRRNGETWKVTMAADDFFSVYRDCQRLAGDRKDDQDAKEQQ